MTILCSTAALCLGFLLDMIFGDPHNMPHIVRAFGSLISALERITLKKGQERVGGVCLVLIVTILCGGIPCVILFFTYHFSLLAGFAVESLLCYQLLAAKSLRDESMKVFESLKRNDLDDARINLSMIVGRDTEHLDSAGVAGAAIESVAENTSDGVIAPMFYIMLGGGALGCLYKAVNTMDSMIGYKNDKYLMFGRAAARLDDFMNLIPSRLAALLMIASAYLCGFDARSAYRIWRRDRKNHASPNSAQTESACAGALGIRLGGPTRYFGKLIAKPTIGDDTHPVEMDDILRANKLMYTSAVLMLVLSVLVRGLWYAAL